MVRARSLTRAALLAASAVALTAPVALTGTTATAADADASSRPTARALAPAPVAAEVTNPRFTTSEVALMARTSGRTVAEQRVLLDRQADSNNTLARLQQRGYTYDGAFLSAGKLVVRAATGTPAARAAEAAGALVRPAAQGEQALADLQQQLTAAGLTGVRSLEVDVKSDRLVVGTTDGTAGLTKAAAALVRAHADAVTLVDAPALRTQAVVTGGTAVYNSGGGRCSAGFPARSSNGTRYMVWAGHCLEGGGNFTSNNTKIGTFAASGFVSYDGRADRDYGILAIDAEDSVSTNGNSYGSGRDVNAPYGASKPAVGTQLCKTGSTTGVTCGQISSYNNTVTYTDSSGRTQASVSGLMRTTVCTQPGDSGGAYVAGGYAVGLTSGGPSNQTCTYNGGFESGKSSYVQPVTDALQAYGLTYN